jgi:hypothetical protein
MRNSKYMSYVVRCVRGWRTRGPSPLASQWWWVWSSVVFLNCWRGSSSNNLLLLLYEMMQVVCSVFCMLSVSIESCRCGGRVGYNAISAGAGWCRIEIFIQQQQSRMQKSHVSPAGNIHCSSPVSCSQLLFFLLLLDNSLCSSHFPLRIQ